MTATSKYFLVIVSVVVICAVLVAGFIFFRSAKSDIESPVSFPADSSSTFTFFGIGSTTKFSGELQSDLEDLLGDGGKETRTTIDLTMGDIEDFAVHFPHLHALHQALNNLPRQRVEHDTIRLTYRYARRQSVPFDRIRLVFSGQRETPLFISLYSKRDGADFIESIQKKHGEPQIIGDENTAARTLYWQKENELMIIVITRNRIGYNEYNFGIYYLDNLTALADTEKAAREAEEREKEKTGELAF